MASADKASDWFHSAHERFREYEAQLDPDVGARKESLSDNGEQKERELRVPKETTVLAQFDFPSDTVGDLPFNAGETITNVSELPGEGWWTGWLNGKTGIFPSSYVERLDDRYEVTNCIEKQQCY